MGSLGAPGCFGWAPAISFSGQDEYSHGFTNAYVTPIPDFDPRDPMDEDRALEMWERIRKAVLKQYR